MELTQISNNLFVPKDFENSHHYYADSEGKKEYTGATTVLGVIAKPQLIAWASNQNTEFIKENAEKDEEGNYYVTAEILEQARTYHAKKKEAAGVHGTDTHALVEQWIKACISSFDGKPVDTQEEDAITPFKKWALNTVDHFLFTERRMADPEKFFAGTADFGFVSKNGKRWMADFKTSSGIWTEYWYQVAAYRYLAELAGDEPYDGQCIIRLGKDGKFEEKYTENYVIDRDAFFSALNLYRAKAYHKN